MILVTEFLHPAGETVLARAGLPYVSDAALWSRPEDLRERLADCAGLIVRNQTRVDAALVAAAPRLVVVGRLGVGLDNIDQDALRARGIALVHARTENAASVAEYVFAALLHFARALPEAAADVAAGGWNRARFGGFELRGKTLGLVGLGEIGVRVAARARAFGLRTLAADPARTPGDAAVEEMGVELAPVDEVLARSHFVSLHAPLTPRTRAMADAAFFAKMRAGAYLINAARGELVDATALIEALRSGRLAGAVLDVVPREPLPPGDPLRSTPRLWITPHIAGLTEEAQARISENVTRAVVTAVTARAREREGTGEDPR